MTADANTLNMAAHDYERMDDQGAASLTIVGHNLPAGGGADGGAAGLGAIPFGPPTVGSGSDGGAGGLGTPR
jgi:hypothetical protein